MCYCLLKKARLFHWGINVLSLKWLSEERDRAGSLANLRMTKGQTETEAMRVVLRGTGQKKALAEPVQYARSIEFLKLALRLVEALAEPRQSSALEVLSSPEAESARSDQRTDEVIRSQVTAELQFSRLSIASSTRNARGTRLGKCDVFSSTLFSELPWLWWA